MDTKDMLEAKSQEIWQQLVDIPSGLSQAGRFEYQALFWERYEAMIVRSKKLQKCHKRPIASMERFTTFEMDNRKKQLLWRQIFRDNIHQMFTIWVTLALCSNLILIFSGVSAHLLLSEIIETLKIGNLLITLPCVALFFGRIQAKTNFLNTAVKISPEQISGINPMSRPDCVYYDQLVDIRKHALGICLMCDDNSNAYYGYYEALVIPYALKDFDKALQQIYFYWENSKMKHHRSLSD